VLYAIAVYMGFSSVRITIAKLLAKYKSYVVRFKYNTRDLYRRINEFNRSYQSRTNLVKDEKGDLRPDSHILNR
jgi:hypothetical protein